MHTSYIFFLGRMPELSIAEIRAIGDQASAEKVNDVIFAATFPERISSPQKFLDRLGGTIKIAEVFHTLETSETPHLDHIVAHIFRHLHDRAAETGKKIVFGVSTYGSGFAPKEIVKKIKTMLLAHGHRARFVNREGKNIQNIVVKKSLLEDGGVEAVIVHGKKNIYFGETVAVQDIESYGLRDFNRPARSMKIGMLPPKIAQIMINLARPAHTVYDPFCGTGTVLMEALLAGYDAVGSDISEQAVAATKKNLAWLQEKFPETKNRKFHVFQKDARKILPSDFPFPFDVVVAETYLGPILNHEITEKEFYEISRELLKLYKNFLANLNAMFAENFPLVIAIPAFKQKNSYLRIPLFPHQKGFIYDRAGQHVSREIFVRR